VSTVENPLVPPPGTLDAGLRTGRRELFHQLVRSRTFLVGVAILAFWIVCAVVGERLTPNDPYETGESVLTGPDATNWFGTDKIGRDVFARVVAGARDILIVAPLATLLGTVLGTIFGLVVGYYRGLVDDVISRVIDAVLALPLIIFAVTVVAALGTSRATVIVVIGVVFTPLIARTVRATVLSERELDYVQAAKLRGERGPYIMFVEILPNVMAPILVEFTVRLGYAIFAVASLSFIGYGLQPPSPDWAVQVFEHYSVVSFAWWTVLFPSLAIASLVVAVNLIADAITHVLES
jgi:peptide/nickel transport system permease protein